MYIEKYLKNDNFYHYINLYNYTNIKLLYNHIITEVPFLEIEEDKMLSFENKKNYTKGTISNQLQEYTNKQNLIDYINNTNSKYNSNNFYDKFFYNNNDVIYLQDYNKNINTTAYLGLFPFKENIIKDFSKLKNNNVHFLIACEVTPKGKLLVKAFNENLLKKILSNNDFYDLKFKYNLKNRELNLFLKYLYLELNLFLSNNNDEINNNDIFKEIDKLLTFINLKQNNKKYIYQDSNKINFLFYEKENIVNNNLHDYYKTFFLKNYEIKKIKDENEIIIKYKNTINNKNILNLNLNLLKIPFNNLKPLYIIKYKNKLINLNNFNDIDNNIIDLISIIYLFNLIFKRKNINLFYNMFIVGKDEYLKDYAFNIENIDFNKKIENYINININKKIIKEKNKFQNLIEKIDEINSKELEIMTNYVIENTKVFNNEIKTYNLTYLNYLKKETREELQQREILKNITFFEKLKKIIFKEKNNIKYKNIINIDDTKYQIDKILNSKIGNKIIIKENIFELKENIFIDLNIFNNFTLNELIIFYIKSVLKSNVNDNIKTIYNKNKKLDFILPVIYGKSNILIDKIKSDYITNIIIDKPDAIPVYYLYPILYNSNNVFILNRKYKNNHSGYWSNYNETNIKTSALLSNKINMYLKLNNEYKNDKDISEYIYKKLNFKSNFIKNNSLMSIKEFLNEI